MHIMLTDLYKFGGVYLNKLNCQGVFDTSMKRDRAVGFEQWPQTESYVYNPCPPQPPRSRVYVSWMTAVVKKALLLVTINTKYVMEIIANECWVDVLC